MKKLLLVSFTLLVFIACEELADELKDSLSSFSATVTGNVSSSFSGEATFVHNIDESKMPQTSGMVLNLDNAEDSEESVILGIEIYNADGVQAGTYGFDADETEYTVEAAYLTATTGYIFPLNNKITQIIITSVEGTRVEGSFTLNLSDALGEEVEVIGTFKAFGITQTN